MKDEKQKPETKIFSTKSVDKRIYEPLISDSMPYHYQKTYGLNGNFHAKKLPTADEQ